jgi:DNA-binding FadR family transcriptional regulator
MDSKLLDCHGVRGFFTDLQKRLDDPRQDVGVTFAAYRDFVEETGLHTSYCDGCNNHYQTILVPAFKRAIRRQMEKEFREYKKDGGAEAHYSHDEIGSYTRIVHAQDTIEMDEETMHALRDFGFHMRCCAGSCNDMYQDISGSLIKERRRSDIPRRIQYAKAAGMNTKGKK